MVYNINDTGHVTVHNSIDATLQALPATYEAIGLSAATIAARTTATTAAITAQAEPIGLSTATKATLGTTYARAGNARPGNSIVYLGDSITARGGQDAIGWNGSGFANYSAIVSNRKLWYLRNAGVSGNTSAQMLARFDTDVTPFAPETVNILAGTNDIAQTLGLPYSRTNLTALVNKCYSIGAKPILCTIPPNNTTTSPTNGSNSTNVKANIVALNAWIRRFATANGIDLVDFYTLLVDPTNGNYKTAYYNDGLHPNNAGDYAMGVLLANTLAPVLPMNLTGLPSDAVDPNNFMLNPLLLAGSPVPTSWSNQAGVTGQTISIITGDTSIIGNWFRFDAAATAATSMFFQQKTSNPRGASVVPGNLYALTGRVKSTALSTGQQIIAQLRFQGGSTTDFRAIDRLDQPMPNGGVFYIEAIAPAGSTSVMSFLQLTAGTGDVAYAQVGVYDLTAMGVV